MFRRTPLHSIRTNTAASSFSASTNVSRYLKPDPSHNKIIISLLNFTIIAEAENLKKIVVRISSLSAHECEPSITKRNEWNGKVE
mmetsp:Transcript_6968/g.14182  ORF Transcript_6968/g.14182 Transcript_6968/m.14182 type:complete len:85 (-) Transcript_6968:143-397(-)